MRFMMIVKATADSEAGRPPSPQLLEAMGKYNEQLARAGVLLAAEKLQPSSSGMRIVHPVAGDQASVEDGPFSKWKNLMAGFTLIDVKSREEAIEWAYRMPDPHGYGEGEIELRQLIEEPGPGPTTTNCKGDQS